MKNKIINVKGIMTSIIFSVLKRQRVIITMFEICDVNLLTIIFFLLLLTAVCPERSSSKAKGNAWMLPPSNDCKSKNRIFRDKMGDGWNYFFLFWVNQSSNMLLNKIIYYFFNLNNFSKLPFIIMCKTVSQILF